MVPLTGDIGNPDLIDGSSIKVLQTRGFAIVLGFPLVLGLPGKEMVLLALTLIVSVLTLGSGRATVLQGTVHLVMFAVFLFLAVVP